MMIAIYTILILIYLWGIAICYNACSKDEQFIRQFVQLNPVFSYTVLVVLLLAWPITVIFEILRKVLSASIRF